MLDGRASESDERTSELDERTSESDERTSESDERTFLLDERSSESTKNNAGLSTTKAAHSELITIHKGDVP